MPAESVMLIQLFRGPTLLGTISQPLPAEKSGWHGGNFEPAPGFENVRPLFASELHLLNAGRKAEWREIWEEIQRPGLRLEPAAGGQPMADFIIHLEDGQAWWK